MLIGIWFGCCWFGICGFIGLYVDSVGDCVTDVVYSVVWCYFGCGVMLFVCWFMLFVVLYLLLTWWFDLVGCFATCYCL